MLDIPKVIERNEKFGNRRWNIDCLLEYKLLEEEFEETAKWLLVCWTTNIDKTDNYKEAKKEIIDWCIDIMFVVIWTLHKLGLTSDQITQAFDIVCESNMSKLWAWKDENGKVKKWENFVQPDFSEIIDTL